MKQFWSISLSIILSTIITFNSSYAVNSNDEIIGTVNGENLYLSQFNRLLNAGKKDPNKSLTKEKILELMINELLVLQEAKARNIDIPQEEIIKQLNLVKEKQGGEEAFRVFLTEYSATLEDAQNEIKNKLLYEKVKNEIMGEFKQFLTERKLTANIVVYNDKIFPNIQEPNLRTEQYPTITKSKIEEIKNLEIKTNELVKKESLLLSKEQLEYLESHTRQRQDITVDEADSESITPGEPIAQSPQLRPEPTLTSGPKDLSNPYSIDLNNLNVFKKTNSDLQNLHLRSPKDLTKELQDLKQNIDQKRVTNK